MCLPKFLQNTHMYHTLILLSLTKITQGLFKKNSSFKSFRFVPLGEQRKRKHSLPLCLASEQHLPHGTRVYTIQIPDFMYIMWAFIFYFLKSTCSDFDCDFIKSIGSSRRTDFLTRLSLLTQNKVNCFTIWSLNSLSNV